MSGRTVTKYVLICDGCGEERPEGITATEARAEAYLQGWRFPPRRRMNGEYGGTSSDVCAACLPGWEARPARRA